MDVHMFILLKFIIIGFDPAPYSFHHTAILFLPTSLLMDPHKVGDIPFRISLFFLGSGYIPIWWFPIMWLPLRDRLQQRKLILAKKQVKQKTRKTQSKTDWSKKQLDRKNHKKKQNKNKTLIFLSFLFFMLFLFIKPSVLSVLLDSYDYPRSHPVMDDHVFVLKAMVTPGDPPWLKNPPSNFPWYSHDMFNMVKS